MSFHTYPSKSWKDILPLASEEARDLVNALVTYQSTSRLSALEVSALSSPVISSVLRQHFADSVTGLGTESRLLLRRTCKLAVRANAVGKRFANSSYRCQGQPSRRQPCGSSDGLRKGKGLRLSLVEILTPCISARPCFHETGSISGHVWATEMTSVPRLFSNFCSHAQLRREAFFAGNGINLEAHPDYRDDNLEAVPKALLND